MLGNCLMQHVKTPILTMNFWLGVGIVSLRTSHLNSELLIPFHSHRCMFFPGCLEITNRIIHKLLWGIRPHPFNVLRINKTLGVASTGNRSPRVVWDKLGCAQSISPKVRNQSLFAGVYWKTRRNTKQQIYGMSWFFLTSNASAVPRVGIWVWKVGN